MPKNLVTTLLRRLREPSSYSGIAVLLATFGLSQQEAGALIEFLAAISGLAAVFLSEPGGGGDEGL